MIRGMLFLPWKDILLLELVRLGVPGRGRSRRAGEVQSPERVGAPGVQVQASQAAQLAFPAPPSARPRPAAHLAPPLSGSGPSLLPPNYPAPGSRPQH